VLHVSAFCVHHYVSLCTNYVIAIAQPSEYYTELQPRGSFNNVKHATRGDIQNG
jgi:hypothetical protein